MSSPGWPKTHRHSEQIRAGAGRHVGVTGLAAMGRNLALNIAGRDFAVAVHNRTTSKVDDFMHANGGDIDIVGAHTVEELIGSLERPRAIIVMVQAGPPVDDVIEQLRPYLDAGDVVIDGGNSHFPDSERRSAALSADGIGFLGCGISGGEDGTLHGPSLMPGGSPEAYDTVCELLTTIAAEVDGQPCCTFIGPGGAGHYVKMVHNGIEYADMQLIAEVYDVLHSGLGLSNEAMADVFDDWNDGVLDSFLIDITARVLRVLDDLDERSSGSADERGPKQHLLDLVVDAAGQKGTGRFTAMDALELGAASTVIAEAVAARSLSAFRDERRRAAELLPRPPTGATDLALDDLHDALYAAKIIAYAQGFDQLARGGDAHGWDLRLDELAAIWRGGCIIRARLLDHVRDTFSTGEPVNLATDPYFVAELGGALPGLRATVAHGAITGVALAAHASALSWFDSYRRERLPANLIQAQRDLFGAHTYERTDRDGAFHSTWT